MTTAVAAHFYLIFFIICLQNLSFLNINCMAICSLFFSHSFLNGQIWRVYVCPYPLKLRVLIYMKYIGEYVCALCMCLDILQPSFIWLYWFNIFDGIVAFDVAKGDRQNPKQVLIIFFLTLLTLLANNKLLSSICNIYGSLLLPRRLRLALSLSHSLYFI